MEFYSRYVHSLNSALEQLQWDTVEEIVAALHHARGRGRQVFIMGNGGSAATALHVACDFGKNTVVRGFPRLRVLSLTDNMALFSAHANDNGYAKVFAEQLANLVQPGDVAIGISASGNSPNVLNGIAQARAMGSRTIGWTGGTGGELAGMVDLPVVVPSDSVEQIEDAHLILEHIITLALRQAAMDEVFRHQNEHNGNGMFLDIRKDQILNMDSAA